MKKYCATVGFSLESANVVGYNESKSSEAGFLLIAPQFKNVGSDDFSIQNIKLGEGATSWSDFLQVVDADAVGQEIYYYASADESGFEADGWLSADMSALADVSLAPGQSALLYTEAESTYSDVGEVSKVSSVTPSVAGFNILGNNTPVDLNVQEITLGEGATSWSDFIQFLDEQAVGLADIYYYATADESGFAADGWLSADMSSLANFDIPAGKGFLLYTEAADVNITIPSAL